MLSQFIVPSQSDPIQLNMQTAIPNQASSDIVFLATSGPSIETERTVTGRSAGRRKSAGSVSVGIEDVVVVGRFRSAISGGHMWVYVRTISGRLWLGKVRVSVNVT